MPFDTQAKAMVRNLIRSFEKLLSENILLKRILSTCSVPEIRDTWKKVLEEMQASDDPDYQLAEKELHAKFLPLYAKLERAMDEATALEVLRAIPDPKRKLQ